MQTNSSTTKPALKLAIEKAFSRAKRNGSSETANSDVIISQLASDIAAAIDSYILSTPLIVVVQPGQTVATSSGAGSTTTPGTGQ